MAFLDDVQVAGTAPASGGAKTATPASGSSSFLGNLSIGPSTVTPKAPVASAPTPVIPAAVPKPTGNLFSGFMSFASNALSKTSDAISRATSAPDASALPSGGKNALQNTVAYLPSELARAIPGVAELQDDSPSEGASAPDFYTKVLAPQKQKLDAMEKTVDTSSQKSIDAYNALVATYNSKLDKYNVIVASDKANGVDGKVKDAGIEKYINPFNAGIDPYSDANKEARDTYQESIIPAVKDFVRGTAGYVLSVPAGLYALGQIGLNPNQNGAHPYTGVKVNIPGLGEVSDVAFQIVDNVVNKGQDPAIATLDALSGSIFSALLLTDVVSRIAGPRYVKVAETTGNINDYTTGDGTAPRPTLDSSPKTGRLYEAQTAATNARVMPAEMVTRLKSEGTLGAKFNPEHPVFFRTTLGKGGTYTSELIQIKPSYLETALGKMKGGPPTSNLPAILSGDEVDPFINVPPAQIAAIVGSAGADDVTVLHSATVTKDSVLKGIQEAARKSQPLAPVAPLPPEPPVSPAHSMAQTVAHNVLRLGGGDTSLAAEGGKVLQSDIKSHVKTHGEAVTHQVLQDKLGVDGETAGRLIAETRPLPKLSAPAKPSTFLANTTVSHGAAEGVNLKQPTKLSNEDAAPLAEKAADTHWRDIQEPAIAAGKPIVIGADDLKDHFAKDYNDNNHPVYSRAAFLEYEHALKVSPVKEVVFTGGGPASGKTELVTKDLVNRGFKGIVYDSNMANYEGVKKQIEMARAVGFKVVVKGVLPNLENARTFSILRGNEIGRHISDATFARGHAGFPNVAKELMEQGIISEHDMHILDTRGELKFTDALRMVHDQEYIQNPLDILRKLDYNEENFKQLYAKEQFDASTGQRLDTLPGGSGAGEAPSESGADQGNALEQGDEGVLGLTAEEVTAAHYTVPQPMRGYINPGEIVDDIQNTAEQMKAYVEAEQHTTELTGTVNDAIYKHEGARKANRQRAIQLLQTRGNDLTAEGWEKLYHFDETQHGTLTDEELKIYKEVIVPLKDALTAARTEYRELGGHITTDLGEEMTPRYAKEKGGPIDKLLGQVKEVAKGAKTLYNGGLLSKSVGSGAKHRIFYALTDSNGVRTVASIPNAKASKVTTFKNGVLTDIGPKSGKEGKTFTDENGKVYTVTQATTKEIEAHTKTRYHKNVLANYVLANDRTSTALGALKLLDRLLKTPEFSDLIYKENPEEAPPGNFKDLSGVLPQFRGYYAEPKLWEALKDLASRLQGREPFPILDEINNFLTSMIVLNPIMHFPNVAMGWASAEAGTGAIPGGTAKSRSNFARAVNEVKNRGPLYLTYLEHGAPFMAIKGTAHDFTKAVLDQYSEEVKENPAQHEALAKALGYANPVAWMKGLNKLNEDITWGGNDIMFMHAILDWADKNGGTPEEAIKEISKRMADYRLPSRIGPGKLGRAISLTLQSRAFLFSRFHYSGVLKPWVENIKDTAAPGSSAKERLAGVRTLVYLGLMALVVYPFIDKMLQGLTGDKKTYISDAGATKVIQNVSKLATTGVSGIPAFGQSMLTLSPATTAAIELGFNVDLYSRNPIYGNPPAQGMSQFGISMIAPLSSGSRMSPGDFALSLLGIYTPKNAPGKNALDAQKYDELPALQVQVKKLIVSGNQAKADALMKDFNDRAIANYNANALATGAKPLAADGSENEAFLKQWGIAQPGQKALDNASALYGDGSLTSKSSLVDNVVLYAKAVGTDPATAFERIFTGQHIVRVTGGPFNPGSSIIVERMPLASSEMVKRDRSAAPGQVLDHVIPLEAGGSNDRSNLNLIPAANNVGEQHTFENMLGDAVKKGVITQAQVREYSIRYKVGQGETLPQEYMNEYASKYGSKPLTLDEVHQLILDNEPK